MEGHTLRLACGAPASGSAIADPPGLGHAPSRHADHGRVASQPLRRKLALSAKLDEEATFPTPSHPLPSYPLPPHRGGSICVSCQADNSCDQGDFDRAMALSIVRSLRMQATRAGEFRTAWSRPESTSSSCFSSHLMVLPIAVLTRFDGGAALSRFFSAVIMSTTWRRRTKRASSSCASASRCGRTSGRIRSPKRASSAASIASDFASRPVALAKSLTCPGLIATTGSPAPASAATARRSRPPVASSTIRVGARSRRRSTRSRVPASEFDTLQDSAVGETAISRTALET